MIVHIHPFNVTEDGSDSAGFCRNFATYINKKRCGLSVTYMEAQWCKGFHIWHIRNAQRVLLLSQTLCKTLYVKIINIPHNVVSILEDYMYYTQSLMGRLDYFISRHMFLP